MNEFKLVSPFGPKGDQPKAIEKLTANIMNGDDSQVLLGVTGSGKTFTIANVIENVQKPTLVIAHNKTLAAQLCGEFKEFFPNSAVEFFVSYYDYYQPEAYIAASDAYIEKVANINDEIDRLRYSATSALNERRDVIIVASVSCIYGLGNPLEFYQMGLSLREGNEYDRDELIRKLIDIQYERNDYEFVRGTFRVRGDVLEIFPVYEKDKAVRVEFFGDEIERISDVNALTGEILSRRAHFAVFPASHYATSRDKLLGAIGEIENDLHLQLEVFKSENKLIEAQRIEQRTNYDIEMMKELGYCTGIENYSRYFDGRAPGTPPYTLIDYFPDDFLLVVDESHATIPQVRAMYAGDKSRKENLINYGFRLPAASDNRPLKFDEFETKAAQTIFVSATPAEYEINRSNGKIIEQVIRPTGLLDPPIEIRPVKGQIDDLLGEIHKITENGFRTLVTTLTKKMAEGLTEYLDNMGIKVRYMHSDIATVERMEIVRDLRMGDFDVLVGINLLREGLDLPEVAMVAILDADKEGFLRSATSLIQTVGRAARNSESRVIMYADRITNSMQITLDETDRRREIQMAYNNEHGIIPETIVRSIHQVLEISSKDKGEETFTPEEKEARIKLIEEQMQSAAAELDFESAAKLRDQWMELKGGDPSKPKSANKPGMPGYEKKRAERSRKSAKR